MIPLGYATDCVCIRRLWRLNGGICDVHAGPRTSDLEKNVLQCCITDDDKIYTKIYMAKISRVKSHVVGCFLARARTRTNRTKTNYGISMKSNHVRVGIACNFFISSPMNDQRAGTPYETWSNGLYTDSSWNDIALQTIPYTVHVSATNSMVSTLVFFRSFRTGFLKSRFWVEKKYKHIMCYKSFRYVFDVSVDYCWKFTVYRV